MAIIATDSALTFTPAPEGLFSAVCVDVVDLGEVETRWGKQHKIEIWWQIRVLDDKGEELRQENGNRFLVRSWYSLSTNPKSNLSKHLAAWRGKPFTDEERKEFDVERVLGANCQLQIQHNIADGGRTFANVQAIVKPLQGVHLEPEDFVRKQDRESSNGDSGKTDENGQDLPF